MFESASRTLAGPWKPVGSIIADVDGSRRAWPRWIEDSNGRRDGDFWGPDVHELPNGKFAASYSAPCGAHRCVGIAWAGGPDGPWTHADKPFIAPANNGAGGGDSYDPNLLVTSAGHAYVYWVVPGRGVYVDAVDYDAGGRLSIKPGAKPTLVADRAKGQRGEGPYVVEHDGGYYEFYSTGSLLFDYHVGVRRGDAPDAPFTTEAPRSCTATDISSRPAATRSSRTRSADTTCSSTTPSSSRAAAAARVATPSTETRSARAPTTRTAASRESGRR